MIPGYPLPFPRYPTVDVLIAFDPTTAYLIICVCPSLKCVFFRQLIVYHKCLDLVSFRVLSYSSCRLVV